MFVCNVCFVPYYLNRISLPFCEVSSYVEFSGAAVQW